MKHHFPQYTFKLLKDASGPDKDPKHYDPTIFGMRLNQLHKECVEMQEKQPPGSYVPVGEGDVINVISTANAEHALWRGKGLHTFVDPDTEDVIHRAICKLDNEVLSRYRPANDIGILYRAGKDPIMYNFSSEDGKGACINVETMGIYRMDDLAVMSDDEYYPTSGGLSGDKNLAALKESMRFISGCFMMQECFPDVFLDGVPDYVKHPSWFKKLNARSISVDRVRTEVCPHIRSGHFRLLSSDRYVHKKGQVVFVKASMVNGKAKHTELKVLNAKKKSE